MTKFKLPLIAATLLSASLLTSPAFAKTLVYCTDGSPEGFDPALYTSETTLDASSLLYDRLVEIKPGETEVQPGLAQSWSASEDGLEHTFNLRSSVKFQKRDYFEPTRDFNADDVVFSFERQLKKDNPWHEYAKGRSWEYFNALSMQDTIKEIEKVDDFTVKFILNESDPTFLYNLTMDFASIVSKEYAESLEEEGDMEDFDTKPVGTGPYRLVSEDDVIVRYRVHPEYWDAAKEMHSIVHVIFPDPEERLEKMELSQCHAMSYPRVEDLEKIRSNEELTLMETQGLNIGYLAYNTELPPFDKPEVRKALNMSIDKQAILDEVFGGEGQIAKNPIPPTMWSYNEEIEDDTFDPDKAKTLLEEADVEGLAMTLLVKQEQPTYQKIAEMIQSDFSEVGVEVEIVADISNEGMDDANEMTESEQDVMDSSEETVEADSATESEPTDSASDNSDEAETDEENAEDATEPVSDEMDGPELNMTVHAYLHEWDDKNGDPDNFLNVLLGCDSVGGFNYAQWCNEEFNTLIMEAKSASEQEERSEKYKKAQEIFKEQAPWATLIHAPFQVVMSNQIVDYEIDPRGKHLFIDTNFYEEPEEEEESEEDADSEGETSESEVIEIDMGDALTTEAGTGETADATADAGINSESEAIESDGSTEEQNDVTITEAETSSEVVEDAEPTVNSDESSNNTGESESSDTSSSSTDDSSANADIASETDIPESSDNSGN